MKLIHVITFLFFLFAVHSLSAQQNNSEEQFGKTLNAGAGVLYYRYVGYPVPVIHADFEMQIEKNLTVAPAITMYTYRNNYLWGDSYHDLRHYDYTETVTIVSLKVSYYFDELLNAGSDWDFYSAGSLGFAHRKTSWATDYSGPNLVNPGMGPLYINLHVGSEYHLTKIIGVHLDLSTGLSTLGLAIHL